MVVHIILCASLNEQYCTGPPNGHLSSKSKFRTLTRGDFGLILPRLSYEFEWKKDSYVSYPPNAPEIGLTNRLGAMLSASPILPL